MRSWILLVVIIAAWWLWAIAALARNEAYAARAGIPKDQRYGISLMPVIPLFPLACMFLARVIDGGVASVGHWSVGCFHVGMSLLCLRSIVRSRRCLNKVDGRRA